MHMRVGPVSAGSVKAWVVYGRDVLARARLGAEDAATLEPAVVDVFEQYLDEWSALAGRGPVVVWVADVPPEQVEFLAHAFYRLASHLAEQAVQRGYPVSPPEGDEFYQALVAAVIDALGHEDRATGEFSEQLRQAWPGLKEP